MKIDSTPHHADSAAVLPDADVRKVVTRRRFMAGASGATGVLLAVQAKTALGQAVCQSPSAMVSGNQSPRPDEGPGSCGGGYSPGYWKQPQKFGSWVNAVPPTFVGQTSNYCPNITGQGNLPPIQAPGTLASAILAGAPDVSMWLILADPNSYNPDGQLKRHLLAAWLNFGYLGSAYPISGSDIQQMWLGTRNGGSSYYPNGATVGWTAQDVIAYISGMYDLFMESMNGPDICAADPTATTTPGKSKKGGK